MFEGIHKDGDLSHLWIHRNQWIWTSRRMANSRRELRDTLTQFSEPDFFLDVDWNYDDVELSIDGKWVIVKQLVTTRIPFGALDK